MQPEQPTSPLEPYQPMEPQDFSTEPPKNSKRKRLLIVVAAILPLLLGVAAGVYISKEYGRHRHDTGKVTLPSISSTISASDVAKLNKEATFWGYFKNAAMQQQLVTEHKQYDTDKPGKVNYYKLGFDFKTKALQAAADEVLPEISGRDKTRCYDGKYYHTVTWYASDWDDNDILEKPGYCDYRGLGMYLIVDGTNTGGLSDSQANAFVSFLRDKEGLSNVRSLQLEQHEGKNYLHYTVDFVPIPKLDSYGGNIWFGTAFDKTGLDPDAWPYYKGGVIGGGTHLEYYVDPATKLPVYGKTTGLPMKDKDGKDKALTDFSVSETRYYFGKATFDVAITNNDDLKVGW